MDVTKGDRSFQRLYEELCKIHNCTVLYRVNVYAHMGVLDFCGDGISRTDWRPILKALSMDRSLHFLAIRSKDLRRQNPVPNDKKTLVFDADRKVIPRFILAKLSFALRDIITVNTRLTGLELDGLRLTMNSLLVLSTVLSKSVSLQFFSLRRCGIGDSGCQIICSALRNNPKIISVDLSACDLTKKGAFYVSQLLQYQNLSRCNEDWQQSLRYRTPKMGESTGLLRVILSHNKIGDQGAQLIIRVLYDDRWLKAIDLQNCHLTEDSGQDILELFQFNNTISIFDVRNNNMMSPNTITAIILQLRGKQSQFEWSPDDPTCPPRTASQTTVSLTGLRKTNEIRKTTSNIFPTRNKFIKEPRTCFSTPNIKHRAACDNRLLRKRVSTSGEESYSEVETLQKRLEEIKDQLEEEIVRRKEAEVDRDKALIRLESHLQELTATQAAINGRVIIDRNVIQQVNRAFCDVNQLLAMMGGSSKGQISNLAEKPSYPEEWTTGTSYSSEIKCYNDEPTSVEASDAKTTDIATTGVKYSSSNDDTGAFSNSGEIKKLSNSFKKTDSQEEDTSTLCTEEELQMSKSLSDQSDPSWITMTTRSSIKV